VAEAIWSGKAMIGTDGSAANDHGTYSFVILMKQSNVEATFQILQSILKWILIVPKE
jgi:hypothetical protein